MKRPISKLYFGNNPTDCELINKMTQPNKKKPRKEKTETKKKKEKTEKNNEDDDDDDDDNTDSPFKLPSFLGEDDTNVYIKENHLYYHTDVNQDSVAEVKQLMRQYSLKIKKLKSKHSCIEFTPKPLYLHIYSPGGDVHAGFSLFDYIIAYKEHIPVYTIVEGMAASAATIISVAGTQRFITPSSYMLIHQLSTFMSGNFEQLKDEFENSTKVMEKIINIYETYTKITKKKIPRILKHDLIWDANECKKNGLVDDIKLVDIFNDN
jgi:ATP-dependent protease ClpP protease subunit